MTGAQAWVWVSVGGRPQDQDQRPRAVAAVSVSRGRSSLFDAAERFRLPRRSVPVVLDVRGRRGGGTEVCLAQILHECTYLTCPNLLANAKYQMYAWEYSSYTYIQSVTEKI